MALQPQLVSIPFAEGLDTKTDPKKTPAQRLTVAENVVFEKAGMLSRRRGHRVLSRDVEGATDAIDACEAIAAYNDELLCFTGSTLYSYSAATERWVNKGRAAACAVSERSVIRSDTHEHKNADVAQAGGLTLTAWEDSRGGVRYSVVDATTGTVHVADAQVAAAASRPRVVAFTGAGGAVEFAVFYADGVNLRYKRVNTISPTVISSAFNPATTMHATENHFDVCVIADRLFIAFNTAANQITHTYLTNAWATSGVTTTVPPLAGNTQCVALFTDEAQNLWTAYGTSAEAGMILHNYALVQDAAFPVSLAGTAIARVTGAWWAANSVAVALVEIAGSVASQNRVAQVTVTTAGVASSPVFARRSVGLAGEAFAYDDELFVPVAHESTEQSSYFLLRLNVSTAADVVAKCAYGVGGGIRSTSTVSNVITESTTDATGSDIDAKFTFAGARKSPLMTESSTTFTRLGVTLYAFDLATRARLLNVDAGGTLLIAGGCLQMYDGSGVVEHGFHLYPEVVTAPSIVVGGGSLSAGTYQYCFVYERTDRTGRIHRSAPSVPVSVGPVSAGDRVALTVPTLRITAASDVRLVIYRTVADGTTFYRATSASSPTLNDVTADSVSYTDGASDGALSAQEFLYTTGDLLPNIEPDACTAIAQRAGRVYLAGFSDPNALQYSKALVEGEPVAFAAEFRQQVDETGGAITALAAMDDKTLIFKSGAIFYHAGDGPNDFGEQSDFGDAKLLSNDVGCVDPASVCLTPLGVFFKSDKGFYLVDRGLGVSYIGAPVENWNDYTVTGAALVPGTNRVIFVTANGPAMVYDHFFQQWSTFTNHEAVGCTVWRGQFVFAKSNGTVFVSDSSKHSDGDRAYRLRVVRSWLSFAGMTGFQRLYEFAVLGEYKGGHKLRVQVGFDFNDNFTEEKLWDVQAELEGAAYGVSTPYGGGSPYGGEWPLYMLRFQQAQQICTSFRIALEEVQTQNYNEALSLSELSFVVGVDKGLYRLRASRSLGTS